jgi:hypothetical protein
MATNFPTSLDSLTNPTSSDSLNSPSHSAQHANVNDAVEALQAKVGVDSSAVTSSLEYRIAQLEAAGSPIVKVAAFTSSGSWTVPAGVTYAVAHIRGGGGGANFGTSNGGTGGTSSVAFSGGTVSAIGGGGVQTSFTGGTTSGSAPATNSGEGGFLSQLNGDKSGSWRGNSGAYIVAGDTVTPAASITVTVGAGGTGNRAGADGYVWIEYQES